MFLATTFIKTPLSHLLGLTIYGIFPNRTCIFLDHGPCTQICARFKIDKWGSLCVFFSFLPFSQSNIIIIWKRKWEPSHLAGSTVWYIRRDVGCASINIVCVSDSGSNTVKAAGNILDDIGSMFDDLADQLDAMLEWH